MECPNCKTSMIESVPPEISHRELYRDNDYLPSKILVIKKRHYTCNYCNAELVLSDSPAEYIKKEAL